MRSEIGDPGGAAKAHRPVDLAAKNVQHVRHARLPGDCHAP